MGIPGEEREKGMEEYSKKPQQATRRHIFKLQKIKRENPERSQRENFEIPILPGTKAQVSRTPWSPLGTRCVGKNPPTSRQTQHHTFPWGSFQTLPTEKTNTQAQENFRSKGLGGQTIVLSLPMVSLSLSSLTTPCLTLGTAGPQVPSALQCRPHAPGTTLPFASSSLCY